MMREIIFQGRSALSGRWITGYLTQQPDGRYYIHRNIMGKEAKTLVYPETVRQFTGFVDMNGEKIFEGDILECTYQDPPEPDSVVYEKVIWNNGWYQQDGNCPPEPLVQHILDENAIIAGNIWDNANLLEAK